MIAQAVQILSSFIGALGFSILFNMRGKKLFFAGLGGFVSWTVYLVLASMTTSTFLPNLAASMAATIYAEVLARLSKSPATIFLIGAIIPLVPGGQLYYTMNYAVAKNWGAVCHVWAEDSDHRHGSVRRDYDGIIRIPIVQWPCIGPGQKGETDKQKRKQS